MYQLKVVSPKGIIFQGDVYQTVINTAEGEIGILENHMLLLTNVIPGRLRIEKDETGENVEELATTYGTLEVRGDKAIVLIEEAFPISEIKVDEEKEILKKAEEKLSDSEKLSLKEIEYYEKLRERARILLELAGEKVG